MTSLVVILFGIPGLSQAIEPSLTLGPGKIEVELIPGGQITKNIFVTNNLGREAIFDLSFEDIEALPAKDGGVKFLGQATGQFSLKNYLNVPEQSFVLANGEKKTIPVTVTLPNQAPVGSLHGAILLTPRVSNQSAGPQTRPRLGLLVFVKVAGERQESGSLVGFTKDHFIYVGSQSAIFSLLFKNQGNTYVNPYGLITLKPLFWGATKNLVIKPWFVLPQSSRSRALIAPKLGAGIYQAELKLNRGYNNIIDSQRVWFVVISWPVLLLIIILGLLGSGVVYRFMIK